MMDVLERTNGGELRFNKGVLKQGHLYVVEVREVNEKDKYQYHGWYKSSWMPKIQIVLGSKLNEDSTEFMVWMVYGVKKSGYLYHENTRFAQAGHIKPSMIESGMVKFYREITMDEVYDKFIPKKTKRDKSVNGLTSSGQFDKEYFQTGDIFLLRFHHAKIGETPFSTDIPELQFIMFREFDETNPDEIVVKGLTDSQHLVGKYKTEGLDHEEWHITPDLLRSGWIEVLARVPQRMASKMIGGRYVEKAYA